MHHGTWGISQWQCFICSDTMSFIMWQSHDCQWETNNSKLSDPRGISLILPRCFPQWQYLISSNFKPESILPYDITHIKLCPRQMNGILQHWLVFYSFFHFGILQSLLAMKKYICYYCVDIFKIEHPQGLILSTFGVIAVYNEIDRECLFGDHDIKTASI